VTTSRHHLFTFAEYVELEAISREKYEYFDEQVWAMSRGSI